MGTDLAGLLRASALGDENAFARLYDAVSARIYGLVLRVVRDPAQSEEVAQEALLDIWRTSARFDPARGSAVSWMLTIAHRKAVDRVRSAQASTDREDTYGSREPGAHLRRDGRDGRTSPGRPTSTQRPGLAHRDPAQRSRTCLPRRLHAHRGGLTPGRATRHGQDPNTRRTYPPERHLGGAIMSADIHGLVGAYAVDAIDEQERSAFELHLAECPECQAEVASLREAAQQLSLMSETAPPSSMRDCGARRHPHRPSAPPSRGAVPWLGRLWTRWRIRRPRLTRRLRPRTNVAAPSVRDVGSTTWLATAAAAAALLVGGITWSPWDNGSTAQVNVQRPPRRCCRPRTPSGSSGPSAAPRPPSCAAPRSARRSSSPTTCRRHPTARTSRSGSNQPDKGMVSAGLMPHARRPDGDHGAERRRRHGHRGRHHGRTSGRVDLAHDGTGRTVRVHLTGPTAD